MPPFLLAQCHSGEVGWGVVTKGGGILQPGKPGRGFANGNGLLTRLFELVLRIQGFLDKGIRLPPDAADAGETIEITNKLQDMGAVGQTVQKGDSESFSPKPGSSQRTWRLVVTMSATCSYRALQS